MVTKTDTSRAFTLVELLVTIAVIALLVALLLPAVQSAREAARRVTCMNSFKQVALATLSYANVSDQLPSIHDAKFSHRPIGNTHYRLGWKFTILPFLDEQGTYDLLGQVDNWMLQPVSEEQATRQTPSFVTAFQCPSTPGTPRLHASDQILSNESKKVLFDSMATSQIEAPTWVLDQPTVGEPFESSAAAWVGTKKTFKHHFGLGYENTVQTHSVPAKLKWIVDGLSKTVLIVEQAGNPELFVGDERVLVDSGLWDAWFIEHGSIVGRTWVRRDISSDRGLNTEFLSRPVNFSNLGQVFALHSSGAHVSLCDGSVHFLSSDTSPEVVERLLGRANDR